MAVKLFSLTAGYGNMDNVIITIDLSSVGFLNSLYLGILFSIGKYTNLIFSLRYSNWEYNRYCLFVFLCQHFLKCQSASIRILDNNRVNGRFRLSRHSYLNNVLSYVMSSRILKRVPTLSNSCAKCVNGLDANPTYTQLLTGQIGETINVNHGSFLVDTEDIKREDELNLSFLDSCSQKVLTKSKNLAFLSITTEILN
ncbi:unnamed protein product [Ceutorhynchus assimilis]|uniref:Uncharacterized protein n=1 Tax=Ceutorhynchus assimilis TaxID=467358 RepID=A0A9N9MHI5_9CUCU|nr:unnamed protein product [Ceutorhynchus assimilis]